MERRERRNNFAPYIVGLLMALYIANLLLGSLQGEVEDFKVSGSSTGLNATLSSLFSYAWAGQGLAVVAILVVCGIFILRHITIRGASPFG